MNRLTISSKICYIETGGRWILRLAEVIMPNSLPEIMTIGEAAQYLRISLSSLYKLAQNGKIPCQKVGKHWRFRKEAIDRWLEDIPLKNQAKNITFN
jgi:excisionase family DNA binding protein